MSSRKIRDMLARHGLDPEILSGPKGDLDARPNSIRNLLAKHGIDIDDLPDVVQDDWLVLGVPGDPFECQSKHELECDGDCENCDE